MLDASNFGSQPVPIRRPRPEDTAGSAASQLAPYAANAAAAAGATPVSREPNILAPVLAAAGETLNATW
jgi:hypothetical protein